MDESHINIINAFLDNPEVIGGLYFKHIWFVNLQFAAKLPCTVTLFIAVHGNKQL